MTKEEKATIILEALDKYLQVNWNNEKMYIKAIMQGIEEIEKWEKSAEKKASFEINTKDI